MFAAYPRRRQLSVDHLLRKSNRTVVISAGVRGSNGCEYEAILTKIDTAFTVKPDVDFQSQCFQALAQENSNPLIVFAIMQRKLIGFQEEIKFDSWPQTTHLSSFLGND